MTTIWIAIAAVAAISFTVKALGPALLGDRPLPPRSIGVIDLLAPALLAGLIVSDVAGEGWRDANVPVLAGIAAALVVRWRGSSLLAVVAAVIVTAAMRAAIG